MPEDYINPIDNSLKNLGKNVHVMNLGKNFHMSRQPDIHYPDHQTSVRLPSRISPEANSTGLILLKNMLLTKEHSAFLSALEYSGIT